MKYRSKTLPQGALIEFLPRGAYVKVSAVDPVSHEEVSIVGDRRRGSAALALEAVKKLEYVLGRKRAGAAPRQEAAATPRGRRAEPPSGWDI